MRIGKGTLTPLLGFAALFAVGMVSGSQAAQPEEILIGEFGSLTGTTATFGISTRNGIDIAVEAVNKSGGLLGRKVRLIIEDDQGHPKNAQDAVEKLIKMDHAIALLGEVASSRSLAAAPVAQRYGIPMVTPSSTNPMVTRVGNYIFRACFIDPYQGFVMAKFATKTLRLNNLAVLRDIKNDYSVDLADTFVDNVRKMGGTIVADASYSEGDNDFSAQLMRIKSKNAQAIFVPGYYTEAGLIARQAKDLGLTVPLLGGDGWDSPRLIQIGGDSLNGSYFSNHYASDDPSPENQKLRAEYNARYGEMPDALAVLGYEAANMLFDAIRRANSTEPQKLRNALAQTRDFPGIVGKVTLDADRNAIRPAVVLQIRDGKFSYVETVAAPPESPAPPK